MGILALNTRVTDTVNRREIAHALLFFVLFIALSKAAETLQYTEFRSTPWNPTTALSIIAGIRFRWWSIPVVFASYLAINFLSWSPFNVSIILILSLAQVMVFTAIPALLLRAWPQALDVSVRGVLTAILFGITLSLLSAAIRIIVLESAFNLPFGSTLNFTLSQAIGNAVGILTIVPLFIAINNHRLLWPFWSWLDLINIIAIMVVVYVVFGLDNTDEFKFFYLLFLPVIAFALRRGFAGAALSILLTDLTMIGLLVFRSFEPSIISELQVLMLTLSFAGLTLGATISEREQVALRFQESQSALLRSSRLSLASEMASALAHELNQPLSAIRAYIRSVSRRLGKENAPTKENETDLASAVREVDAMAALIKSMRQFLNRDEGSFEPIDITKWIKETVSLMTPDFRKSGVDIVVNLPTHLMSARGNYVQLQQVLANLLRNAKEARDGAHVTTQIEIAANDQARRGFIEVVVSDNGPGIAPHRREQLFRPLQSDKPDGLGLGLSLCNTIMRSHGGEIWLVNTEAAKGTTFAFTIPTSAS